MLNNKKRRSCDGLEAVQADVIQLRKTRLSSLATEQREVNFPDADGTVALTSDIPSMVNTVTTDTTQTITGAKTFSTAPKIGQTTLTSAATSSRTATLPDITGTIALTSDLNNLVTTNTTQTISGEKTFNAGSLRCSSNFVEGQQGLLMYGPDFSEARIYHLDPASTNLVLPVGEPPFDTLVSNGSAAIISNKDLSSSTNIFPRFFTFLTTPHIFAVSTTINAGNTQNFQISGNGTPTIPATASAVLVSVYGSVATSGGYIEANRQGSMGALNNNLFLFQASSNAALWGTTAVIPLNNSNGQISFRANGSNITISGGTALGYFN